MFAKCCASRKGPRGSAFEGTGPLSGIVFIGGNQSSGKSTACHAAIDEFFPYAKYISQDDRYGPDGTPNDLYSKEERHLRLAQFAREWAERDHALVFVDQVDYTHVHTDNASLVLQGAKFPVQSVLLYLHLADYPKRIAKRTSEGDPRELSIALKQYAMFFAGTPTRPEQPLETVTRADLDRVFAAFGSGLSHSSPSRAAVAGAAEQAKRRQLRQLLEASLRLDEFDTVFVVPRHAWDYVVDTSVNPVRDAARLLRDRVVAAATGGLGSVLRTPTAPNPVALGYYAACNRCGPHSDNGQCAACVRNAAAYFTTLTGSADKGAQLAHAFYDGRLA